VASATLSLGDRFPAGTSLSIYPRSNFNSANPPVPGLAPIGSSTATASSDSTGSVTFSGLADGTEYVVTDAAGSKYVAVKTAVPSGDEITYAERTSDTSALGAAFADIPGLSVTFTPTSSQALVHLHLPRLSKDATASFVNPALADPGNTVIYGQTLFSIAASSFGSNDLWAKLTGLTPGTPITVKGRISCGSGQVTVNGAATMRPFIEAIKI
jgi:hypothetical protein